jgi:hypothetical protein
VITAPNPEMEALAIAVAMRDAFARQKSASLVTPDRALARRVMAALGRWNLDYDDSGGDPVTETPAGIFARLVLDAIAEETAPAELLALCGGMPVAAAELARGIGAAARGRFVRDMLSLDQADPVALAGAWETWLKNKESLAAGFGVPQLVGWLQRWVADLVLVALAAMGTIGAWGYIGVVPILTGVAGTCPLYSVFGLSTCPVKKTS